MKITITRHSKTLWNKEKRLQGCKDSPLSPEGMDNILALKEHIKNNHYDAIYSSPIKRAYDTAKLLFDNQPIITDERIREMNFGLLEGQKINEIPEKYKKSYHDLWCHPEISNGIPEGETYDEIEERIKDFLNDLELDDATKTLLRDNIDVVKNINDALIQEQASLDANTVALITTANASNDDFADSDYQNVLSDVAN